MEATHFNSMVTGLNMFSVVEELSSPAFCKIAALVSPKRGYPELPDLSDNPCPSYICFTYFTVGYTKVTCCKQMWHIYLSVSSEIN